MKNHLKVLLIDQSPLVLPRLRNLLLSMEDDITIGEARNRAEALEIMNVVHTDALIMDTGIPGIGGINLLIEMKKKFPGVKLIAFTNYVENNFKNICIKFGADHFIEKATEFEKIIEIFRTMLSENKFEAA